MFDNTKRFTVFVSAIGAGILNVTFFITGCFFPVGFFYAVITCNDMFGNSIITNITLAGFGVRLAVSIVYPCTVIMTECRNYFLFFKNLTAAFTLAVCTFCQSGFYTGWLNFCIFHDIVSQGLTVRLFITVAAVIFANHKSFCRFGTGCRSFCAFLILMAYRLNSFVRRSVIAFFTFLVLIARFGAGR